MVSQFEWWFRGGADSAVVERFPGLLERATRVELDHWSHRPRSRLALIIVLDQFSRSVYRGTARAFAQDQKALALALQGIEIGHYAALETPWEKIFFFLPWGTPRNSRTWRQRSGSLRNSSDRRQQSSGGSWSTRRRKLVAIETSLPASVAILIATPLGAAIDPGGARLSRPWPARPYASAAALNIERDPADPAPSGRLRSQLLFQAACMRATGIEAMDKAQAHHMRLLAHDTLLGNGKMGEGMSIQLAAGGRRIFWIAHEARPRISPASTSPTRATQIRGAARSAPAQGALEFARHRRRHHGGRLPGARRPG